MAEVSANTPFWIDFDEARHAVETLVEAVILDLHLVAGTGSTHLVNEVPDDLVVSADASLVRRVIQNLIANAIKYTPRGTITIGAAALGADAGVECWVSDTGTGIPPELHAQIDRGILPGACRQRLQSRAN